MTTMWWFPSMLTYMIRQMFFSGEWLCAVLTLMWGFACMLPNMIHQMILTRKSFRTILTAKWCFPYGFIKHLVEFTFFLFSRFLIMFFFSIPVCWRMWLTRCSFLVKDFEQKPQRWGDSPVCWRTWFKRCSLRVKVFEQKSQRCGVSPVCHIMWFVKCSFLVNDLPVIDLNWFLVIEEQKKTRNFTHKGVREHWPNTTGWN